MATETTTHPTVDVSTEYGIRRPDGTEEWNSVVATYNHRSGNTQAHVKLVHENDTVRGEFVTSLQRTAKTLGIPADSYIDGHVLITRQRIVTVLPPVVVNDQINLPF